MKFAVMGAGSVGCYYGGLLARAGNPVVLIGRPQHVEAINQNGLYMETQHFQAHVPVEASTSADALRGAKIVLCCVKSTDTLSTAQAMAPFLEPDALVLSLQNGVDNAERLQSMLAQKVSPVVVYVATEMAGPGHVRHHGRGELLIGPTVLNAAQQTLFATAGISLQQSAQVRSMLWLKLLINCCYNALSAITQLPYGRMLAGKGVEQVMRDVFEECLAVAAAEGIALPDDAWQTVLNIARSMPGQRSSTAQDLAHGKPSEIDHLNGYIVRKGAQHGIATPVNRALHTQVKLLEKR